jgi:2-dehydropantoate 2-reductase
VRIGIFGAGAIGGYLAARLAAHAEVTVVARGPHLAAMQAHGIELRTAEGTIHAQPRIASSAAEAGAQDYVIVQSVDPGGELSRIIPPARAIGCVVYPAAEVTAPGVITHTYGDRFSLGEPSGERTKRVEALSKLFIAAGLKAPIRPKIRDEIWVKLWGNLCFNPLSALTGATLDIITTRPDLRAICRAMMAEAQAVAEALGTSFAISLEKRLDGAAEVGVHKTSMLQDLERGRPMEIDALLGAVVELGQLTDQAMPICETILATIRERARTAGCYS